MLGQIGPQMVDGNDLTLFNDFSYDIPEMSSNIRGFLVIIAHCVPGVLCLHDGTIVKNYCCDSFVCGIGQSEGFLYILYSDLIYKWTNTSMMLIIQVKKDGKHIAEACGMLVTSENVFVCSWRNSCICVLDLNLKLRCSPELNHFWPIGTAPLSHQKQPLK